MSVFQSVQNTKSPAQRRLHLGVCVCVLHQGQRRITNSAMAAFPKSHRGDSMSLLTCILFKLCNKHTYLTDTNTHTRAKLHHHTHAFILGKAYSETKSINLALLGLFTHKHLSPLCFCEHIMPNLGYLSFGGFHIIIIIGFTSRYNHNRRKKQEGCKRYGSIGLYIIAKYLFII